MKSPITGKEMPLRKEPRTLTFRKEPFEIQFHYYLCEESGERFTSTELDELNMNQLYNAYREKYNLPFPDEIKAIREMYGLPANRMAEALGFGANVYRNYESGEVPNESNGKLIKLARDPANFRQIVQLNTTLPDNVRRKTVHHIEELITSQAERATEIDLERYFFGDPTPDEYSGYRKPSLDRFTEMVVFFASELRPWKTKLNKVMFYADFECFRQTCFSMSGTRYRAIKMGPVPANFNALFEFIANKDDVDIEVTEFDDRLGEQFLPHPGRAFDPSLFTAQELAILKTVVDQFKGTSTKTAIELSHAGEAWKEPFENGNKLISYRQYAFDLKNIP